MKEQLEQQKALQSAYIKSLCQPISTNCLSTENMNSKESDPLGLHVSDGTTSLSSKVALTNAVYGGSGLQPQPSATQASDSMSQPATEPTSKSGGTTLPLVQLSPEEQAQHNGATHALFIDNSAIELWRCPRLFEYRFLRKRELVASKAGRNFGSTLHIGWACRYLNGGVNEVDMALQDAIYIAMEGYLNDSPQPLDDFRNLNHARTVMHAYNTHYKNEPFKIVSTNDNKRVVEKPFAFHIFNIGHIAVIYCGKIDLAVVNNEGMWVLDHKTTFQFGDAFDAQMQMDGGQLGYVFALKQATSVMPRGYIIDAVRIRRPKKGDEYNEGAAPVDATDFKRMPFFVTEADLGDWQNDIYYILDQIINTAKFGYFPRHRWQCTTKYGRCDMYDVCSVGVASRESALASELYEDSTWSPLNTPEKKAETT